MQHIHFDLDVIEKGKTEGWLEIEKIHKQQNSIVHGGVIATLADITQGFAAYTMVPEDHHVVTGEIKISYLNPCIGQRIRAIGTVLKSGRKLNFCEAEIWVMDNGNKTMIAKSTATMVTVFPEEVG